MSSTVTSILLDAGKQLMSSALAGFTRFAPNSFQLGSASSYTPVSSDTVPQGAIVYTGDATLIEARLLAVNTVRYTMTLPESVGPFSFGSVILYAMNEDGTSIPFAEIVLPFQLQKVPTTVDLNNINPFVAPGSRMIISLIVVHSDASDVGSSLNVTVTSPTFSNLPYYPDENNVPTPLGSPWNQFVLTNHTKTGSPVLVTKRSDQKYWGTPLLGQLSHPLFAAIDGGLSGDAYQNDQNGWLFGRYYYTDDSVYQGQIGGFGYTDLVEPYSSTDTYGGLSY